MWVSSSMLECGRELRRYKKLKIYTNWSSFVRMARVFVLCHATHSANILGARPRIHDPHFMSWVVPRLHAMGCPDMTRLNPNSACALSVVICPRVRSSDVVEKIVSSSWPKKTRPPPASRLRLRARLRGFDFEQGTQHGAGSLALLLALIPKEPSFFQYYSSKDNFRNSHIKVSRL